VLDRRRHCRLGDADDAPQDPVAAEARVLCSGIKAGRSIGLRVHVHQKHVETGLGETRGEVHGGGGLPDPALLVGHGDDAGHRAPFAGHRY